MWQNQRLGKFWSWVGLLFASAATLGGGFFAAFIPPPGAPPGWRPAPLRIGEFLIWPCFAFVAFMMLAHVVWANTWQSRVTRWVGVGLALAISFTSSYFNQHALLEWLGAGWFTTTFGPLVPDGLELMAATALVQMAMAKHTTVQALPNLDGPGLDGPSSGGFSSGGFSSGGFGPAAPSNRPRVNAAGAGAAVAGRWNRVRGLLHDLSAPGAGSPLA